MHFSLIMVLYVAMFGQMELPAQQSEESEAATSLPSIEGSFLLAPRHPQGPCDGGPVPHSTMQP